ncbi:MAG TPA: molybdenum cofactor guanylyltransferase [Thermoanaerobaculia bacterium]|nr:molybdenum cofactor guanylyltransferase [Thermoanaerobaculia bacterium]
MNCYVLTGGRSTRMGESKAALFLDRIIAAAAPVFERVIAVERAGARPLTIDTIFEEPHDAVAPVFGVARALADAPGPSFILAVDFPLIGSDMLAFLRTRFELSNASMLVPMWDGAPQVLCAGYRTCVAPLLAERIAAGRYDLRGLLEETEVEIIDEAALRARFRGEPLMNVNTPAELAAAERIR